MLMKRDLAVSRKTDACKLKIKVNASHRLESVFMQVTWLKMMQNVSLRVAEGRLTPTHERVVYQGRRETVISEERAQL